MQNIRPEGQMRLSEELKMAPEAQNFLQAFFVKKDFLILTLGLSPQLS